MKKSILFVDDEPFVLEAIRRMLRSKQDDWEMAFATGGPEALAWMEDRAFDVVVSDMLMPGMNGSRFLREVMERSPDTIRFILSGHSDPELVYQSIGVAHQYLAKPCSVRDLVSAVERACAIRELLRKRDLRELMSRIQTIPSLPDLYARVVEELKSPDPSVHRVGDIISRDLGMSAKVLQLVNSAFFGLPRPVHSPAQAVALLGIDIVKSLVLMVQVFSRMDGPGIKGFSLDNLWTHSMRVAHVSLGIARQAEGGKRDRDDAFMAGLFHDLGKLLLMARLPDRYEEALRLMETEHRSCLEAERAVLGGTHEEVGAYLLGLWGFADPVVEAAAFHHRPGECRCRQFSALTAVHAANVLVNEFAASGRGAGHARDLDSGYLAEAGVAERLPEWRRICETIMRLDANRLVEDNGEKEGGGG